MTHTEVLNQIYEKALSLISSENNEISIDEKIKKNIEYVILRSESNKGMVTVLATLLTHKIVVVLTK